MADMVASAFFFSSSWRLKSTVSRGGQRDAACRGGSRRAIVLEMLVREGGMEVAWKWHGRGTEVAWRWHGGGMEVAWMRHGGGLEVA